MSREASRRHTRVLAFGKRYHACFIYAEWGLTWVQQTTQRLEDLGFIAFYFDRDAVAGQSSLQASLRSLRKSMKIIVALNRAFINSRTCRFHLDNAIQENLSRDDDDYQDAIIPINLEPCVEMTELRILVHLNAFDNSNDWLDKLVKSIESESALQLERQQRSEELTGDVVESAERFADALKHADRQELNSFFNSTDSPWVDSLLVSKRSNTKLSLGHEYSWYQCLR